MNQNQMNMMGNGYPMPTQNIPNKGFRFPENGKPIFIAFLVFVALIVVGCFLPYAVCKGADISVNYVYGAEQMKDGVFVLGFLIASVLLAFNAKYIGSVIFQVLSLGIFAIDWVNSISLFNEYEEKYGFLGDAYKYKFGIGFYILLIALLGALITSISVFIKNKKSKPVANAMPVPPMQPQAVPQPMQQPVQPQMPVNNNCPYCGSPRVEGSAFCQNCGAKM